MASFNGTMTIEGDDSGVIPVEAVVSEGALTLLSKGAALGKWAIDAITAEPQATGVGLVLDQDRVVLRVGDPNDFLSAVGRSVAVPKDLTRRPSIRSRKRSKSQEPTQSPSAKRPKFGLATYLALGVVVAFVAASAVAPMLIGSVSMLIGIVMLLVGAMAMLEIAMALRLPGGLEGIHLVVVGVTAIVVGMGLTLVG